ncbi:MAG: BamA/TamA family outer membrane protein [Alphaproteobacteria bacterium]|nr:BamA/TamA family outer membrane protein [Alphaproteobacteria bacterium]
MDPAERRLCLPIALSALLVTCGPLRPDPAFAFDFFGLFGSETPPAPSSTTLPYQVEFVIEGDDGVESALKVSSNFYKRRQDPPPDAESLVQRLEADFAPMLDALWSEGYYNATIRAEIGSTDVQLGTTDVNNGAIRTASSYQNRAVVPVTIHVETGPLFTLRRIEVVDLATDQPFPPDVLPPAILRLSPGDPARSADVRAANARIIDYFRAQSYPLVKAEPPRPIVDHTALTMDVTFAADPGRKAGFGEVVLTGPQGFDPGIVRSFIYLEEGQPYSPKALADTRRSITSIPAVGSVRIREDNKLDAYGNLPIFIDVGDRSLNLLGATAGYSNVDGPTANAYYEIRNLFGGAESLRLGADLFYPPPVYGITSSNGTHYYDNSLGARFTASFMKPALFDSRIDFLLDGIAERSRYGGDSFGGYLDEFAGGTAALRYRVDQDLALQAGVKFERGWAADSLGRVNYTFIGFPVSLRYDNTDNLLNPTSGVRATATVTPYPSLFGGPGFTKASLGGSAYYALDERADYILAGRAGFGSIFGFTGNLAEIPANYRFYEGGIASVRGYLEQSIGPSSLSPFGYTIGGLSGFNATIEARIKITDTIGVAPFFDVGGAFTGSTPISSRGDTRMGAGIGFLYYTPIGPIRIDIARPLDPRPGDYPVVFYVSIGQPF